MLCFHVTPVYRVHYLNILVKSLSLMTVARIGQTSVCEIPSFIPSSLAEK